MQFPSWPYVEGISAWGENTSAYNFCEMDYYITPYIAEFINTSTNLGYVYLAYRGISNNRKNNNDMVVNICYALLAYVGIGSAIYHAAPKYFTQMIDEFSMLYATGAILYGALSITLVGSAKKSLAIILTGTTIAVSFAHAMLGHVTTFRIFFLMMVLSVLAQLLYLVSNKVPDPKVRKEGTLLALSGAVTFLFAYGLWNIDMHLCGHLTSTREVVGMPLGFLTEFHGWWHIFTGIAVWYDIVFIEYLRIYIASLNSKSPQRFKFVWTSTFSLPYIKVDHKDAARKS